MSMTVDDYEWTQNLSHEVCGVITSVLSCASFQFFLIVML